MNKILFSAVSALAVAGVAVAADSTDFAVMKVPSSAAETIVSVPWLASATTDADVKVADLVLTNGLNENDELMYYNNSSKKYECWILNNGQWVAETSVTSDSSSKAAAAQDAGIPRGGAIILKRGGTIANCFYIMGKPFTGTESAVEISGGTNVYTLIAPPSVAAVDVNTGITWTGVTKSDRMILADGTSLVWSKSASTWNKRVGNAWTSDNITIPAGTGAWFVSNSADTKTFKIN